MNTAKVAFRKISLKHICDVCKHTLGKHHKYSDSIYYNNLRMVQCRNTPTNCTINGSLVFYDKDLVSVYIAFEKCYNSITLLINKLRKDPL